MPQLRQCDVLVVGGGPAGSTISTRLAQKGYDVVLLEKEHHPRFHIGESLLPANLALLEELGVLDEVASYGMQKWGIEFISHEHDHRTYFEFGDGWNKSLDLAFQVRRSQFDETLLRNAQRKGVEVLEGCRAKTVDFLPDRGGARVSAVQDDGGTPQFQAKLLIDASGRDTLLANKFKIKRKNPDHNSSALYAHFSGAERLEGRREGNITVLWFKHGWFWFIPLADGTTSIGVVCWPYYLKSRAGKPLEQFFMETIAMAPELARRLADAKLESPVHATGNYSYVVDRCHGDGYLVVGDAFTFIDPVFSTGVYMAMQNAFQGAEAVDTVLREPARAATALADFDQFVRKGPREFSWFIYRMTQPVIRDMFMHPYNHFRMKEAVLSLLAGDVYGKMPYKPSLWVFKIGYHLLLWSKPKLMIRSMRQRKINIQEVAESEA